MHKVKILEFTRHHAGRAAAQMVQHNIWFIGLFMRLAFNLSHFKEAFWVEREGDYKLAYLEAHLIYHPQEPVFFAEYGLVDGTELYVYDSRDN